MLIINSQNLARNSLRKKALLIAEAGYEAVDIEKSVRKEIKTEKEILNVKNHKINLSNFRRIFLVGIGKGSTLACATLAKILGKKLTGGIAIDVIKFKTKNLKLETFAGTHPLPSKRNIVATQKIVKLTKNLKKDDLLFTFICGGGSSLLCGSKEELDYSRSVFKNLTKAGADILELNTVRKHLSEIKGGNLAKMAYPTNVISLIVSDVPDNNLSMVASGPTVCDKTSKKDAEKILEKYGINPKKFNLKETPKDKKYFKKVKNILFLSNREPVLAMAKKAKSMNFKPKIYSLAVRGEAKNSLLPIIKKIKSGEAILAAGETTVKLAKQPIGKGGRNTEAVLGAINKFQDIIAVSFASDGRDNTEAAGAIADLSTIKKAQKLKLDSNDYLNCHDSFNFFKKTRDLIFAKQKSFNVSDLMIILKQ